MLIQWMELPKTLNASTAIFFGKHLRALKSQKNRKHPRKKAKNLIKFGEHPEPADWHIANLSDFSESGFKFFSGKRLKVGSLLEIVVLMEGNRQVPVLGKVAWVRAHKTRSYYVGVSLKEVNQHDRELFRKLSAASK